MFKINKKILLVIFVLICSFSWYGLFSILNINPTEGINYKNIGLSIFLSLSLLLPFDKIAHRITNRNQ